ncbi:MAG: hypothetical protein AAB647_01275, partial [Patescibacteria group bacterium]
MRWFSVLGVMVIAIILTGCGIGQSGNNSVPAVTVTSTATATGSPTPEPSPVPPSVLMTVTTDYIFANQAIRFIQYAGDEDFLPVIILVDQGFRFQFALPKG